MIETCPFFESHAASCNWQKEFAQFLKPLEEELRRRFRTGEEVGDLILSIQGLMSKVPSKGEYPNQRAYSENYIKCKASQRIDIDKYSPNTQLQKECSGYPKEGSVVDPNIIQAMSTLPTKNIRQFLFPFQEK